MKKISLLALLLGIMLLLSSCGGLPTDATKLVAKMEAGGLNIDQLMNFFERGCYLTRHCRSYLANMEKKISLLTRDDGKEGEWTDFDADSGKRNSIPF